MDGRIFGMLMAGLLIGLLALACNEAAVPSGGGNGGTPTMEAPPTPAPLTPSPAPDSGREDCPADWAAYNDPDGHFSICHPVDLFATVSEPQAYLGHTLSLRTDEPPAPMSRDGFSLTIYWETSAPPDSGTPGDPCDTVSYWQDVELITLTLADRSVAACAGDRGAEGWEGPGTPPPTYGTFADMPVGPDQGDVVFFLTEPGTSSNIDSQPLASIFGSLRLGQ